MRIVGCVNDHILGVSISIEDCFGALSAIGCGRQFSAHICFQGTYLTQRKDEGVSNAIYIKVSNLAEKHVLKRSGKRTGLVILFREVLCISRPVGIDRSVIILRLDVWVS